MQVAAPERVDLAHSLGERRVFHDDWIHLDTERRWLVEVRGEERALTRTEWSLLYLLCRHAGGTVSHTAINLELFGWGYGSDSVLIKWHTKHLREKLTWQGNPPPIETINGFGYRYNPYFERG